MESWNVLEIIAKDGSSCKVRPQDIKLYYPHSWAIPYDPEKKDEGFPPLTEKDKLLLFMFFPFCTHLAICIEGLICIDIHGGDVKNDTLDNNKIPYATNDYWHDLPLENDPVIPLSFLSRFQLRIAIYLVQLRISFLELTANPEKMSISEALGKLANNSKITEAVAKDDSFPNDFLRRERHIFFNPQTPYRLVPLDQFYNTLSTHKSALNEFFLVRGQYQIGGGVPVRTPDAYDTTSDLHRKRRSLVVDPQIQSIRGRTFRFVEGVQFARGMIISSLLSGMDGDERLKGFAYVKQKWYSVIEETLTKSISLTTATDRTLEQSPKLKKLCDSFVEMGMRAFFPPEFAALPDGRFFIVNMKDVTFPPTFKGEHEATPMTIASPTQGEDPHSGLAPPVKRIVVPRGSAGPKHLPPS